MAGPGLPTNVVAGGAGHVGHTNSVHGIVNQFDTTLSAATPGHVVITDGTTFDNRALLSTDSPSIVVNTRTASYTAVAADAGKMVEMNVGSANTVTFPSGTFAAGNAILVRQYGAGATTIAGSGVTIRSRGGLLALAGQYSEAIITFRSGTEAVLSGDLA